MKVWLSLIGLFLFVQPQSIIQVKECHANKIILKTDIEEFEVSLFNIQMIDNEGWNYTCSVLKEAESIRFEIDPLIQQTKPYQVYLFLDNILLQEDLILKGYAKISIENPKYLYHERMKNAENSISTMARKQDSMQQVSFERERGQLILITISVIILILSVVRKFLHSKWVEN